MGLPAGAKLELLSPTEMADADRLAIAAGPLDGYGLMKRAGEAVAAVVLARYPSATRVHVLCGPGNNGGDGFVVARLLAETGVDVALWASGEPRAGSDAAIAAAQCLLERKPLAAFAAEPGSLIVDALYGAGLSKDLSGDAARAVDSAARLSVVAVDLPSGVSGDSGDILGTAFRADITVTFARKKPGHLLLPGRDRCGEIVVANIGIGDDIIAQVAPHAFENKPTFWLDALPVPAVDAHKYKRGHVGVFSGGSSATGAARLAALAAARSGAGAVTVLSPADAMQVNATHLTAIMLRKADAIEDVQDFLGDRRSSSFVLGPGFGVGDKARHFALAVLDRTRQEGGVEGLVLDADGITSFLNAVSTLFEAAGRPGAPALVMTPHEGEFGRLFPDIADDKSLSKLAKARAAAARANATVIYKGADTVIAASDGRAAINANGAPWLATAGSGDVLAGIIAALLAQGMLPFEAACAAVWIHAEAGSRFGPGLIAEDLPLALVPVLRELVDARQKVAIR
ncbi:MULTISPECIES: bifunctional ADP-dependent NAD(P)H-hydrate dehydratase/NAD(P)H-hydrate epimerase [unclassified Mesorhizobium]|uniref:bifunctional ADP-dependent NAD(P)H-hydrate dehydratase/NAD(P)H-hydrate epimerase n=1 Tax=unclassified Mesorhizobium TaxID=325217 RepID=UPI000429CAC6|nr:MULTISPECIES: bifunctional ADP-dependent NAD(P)H-hydrate dehydratase/NAD(P)H-hydrate epimerase [unclassified Mesorhizobium]WJI69465.1 bifunctional ADP-dependent NAD(P)H-hydrate dehydratase/NAD(P)H-hydrate epimerase [Mesorhizobium sp. C399B]